SLAEAQSSQQLCHTAFREVSSGSLCIRSAFTRTLPGIASELRCSIECGGESSCQAFTMADGPCQLFVFDRCSKSVRDCGCSRRGRLFVKRQPGLEPGALCPPGYADELCGVKYRLINSTATWSAQKLRCESDSGLAMLADVTNSSEMSHVEAMYTALSPGVAVYLGGYRVFPGAAQTDGWLWTACNITVDDTLWGSGEPNSFGEKATARYPTVPKLVDITDSGAYGALC
uniref:C-type lectin domain-containing protein n=1 Tax=Macrostomum lignano TaxID=282301 RepID=A0A1I8J208_9PLAT